MTDVQMTAGVTTGEQYETIRYPSDEILLRVTPFASLRWLPVLVAHETLADNGQVASPGARPGAGAALAVVLPVVDIVLGCLAIVRHQSNGINRTG